MYNWAMMLWTLPETPPQDTPKPPTDDTEVVQKRAKRRAKIGRFILWFAPLFLWGLVLLWSATEGARYETSWRWLQWWLRFLSPEHAPPGDGERVQVNITMYQLNGAARRLAHIVGYAILTALTVRAIQRGEPTLKRSSLTAAIIIALLYTSLDELQRLFFEPNRHAKWLDLILNLIGVVLTLGGTVLYFTLKRWERKSTVFPVSEDAAEFSTGHKDSIPPLPENNGGIMAETTGNVDTEEGPNA
jgi:VanZ family protein